MPSEAANTQSIISARSVPDKLGQPSLPGGVARTAPVHRIGDFIVVRILGEGGMGTVYLAEDGRLKRKAAVKTMRLGLSSRPENRERFLREAQAAAAIEHDNVVPIWHVGVAVDGSPYIAMPFLQGETLESRLRREPVQPLGLILKVAREVAEGLAAAHAKALIHRDVKPSNVWIEGDPDSEDLDRQARRCKILDFGLARSLGASDVHLTATGTVLGTPSYMAPEQAGGDEVDHRADLFSLGVMLYRMATGHLPFAGPTPMAVLSALANVTPPPARARNPNLPRALSDLIDRLMSRDPAGRPRSAAEVVATIRRMEQVLAAKPRRRRAPMLVALALLVLVPLGWWLAAGTSRFEPGKGTLVVEINDPEAEARIKGGRLVLTDAGGEERYTLGIGDREEKLVAGSYKIRVEGADGLTPDTPEFALEKEGRVTVRVTMGPKAAVKDIDPDRKAAEWVLSIGGTVHVNEKDRFVNALADLPKEPFRLTLVGLNGNKHVSDAGLAHFEGCKDLTHLLLWGTEVGDAGLAVFRGCKNLRVIALNGTRVGDSGLAAFKDCKSLIILGLDRTQVSDEGLAYFNQCKALTELELTGTQVSDAGLAHFAGCKSLTHLTLQKTKVTPAKVEELRKALPKCKIEWDGGVIEPKATPAP
jgi:hypothetical protein